MSRAVLSWSGGKDAAMALDALAGTDVHVEELLTTVSASTDRSTMHGVRRSVYEAQADAIGLPLTVIELPDSPSNELYASIMNRYMAAFHDRGFDAVAFGDLQLEDVRAYREERLADSPIDGRWPVWGRDTGRFMDEFIDAGFEAIVVAANAEYLDRTVVGSRIDRQFLASLPDEVDPAGENGEYHTLVVDGPIFERPLVVELGNRVTRDVGDGTTMQYRDVQLLE